MMWKWMYTIEKIAVSWCRNQKDKLRLLKNLMLTIIVFTAILVFCFNPTIFNSVAQHIYNQDGRNSKALGELITLLLAIIGGGIALYGLFLNQKRLNQQVIQNTINEKGVVATRFSNAVEHLANGNPAIVLGGVHSLYQIANDYEEYRRTIFDMFCSYLRNNSKKLYPQDIIDRLEKTIEIVDRTTKIEDNTIKKEKIPEVINVLCRALFEKESVFVKTESFNANLDGCTLVNINLKGYELRNVTFTNAILVNCELGGAEFYNCEFWKAKLTGCWFTNSKISESKFTETEIDDCFFTNVKFIECKFINLSNKIYTLSNCLCSEFELHRCKFSNATLYNCSFQTTTITKCSFLVAKLHDCDFISSSFNCIFESAKFNSCKFSGCIFHKYTIFIECNLGNNPHNFTNCKGVPINGLHGVVNICSIYNEELEK